MTDTLYYDGRCPLCSKEMNLLRRLKSEGLLLADIHAVEGLGKGRYPSRGEMLKILHLQTSSGDWLKGLDANVAAWGHTRVGWLFKPLRWPGLRWLADRVYLRWAERRFCRLEY